MKIYAKHCPDAMDVNDGNESQRTTNAGITKKTTIITSTVDDDIMPIWLLNVIDEVSYDPNVSCHFLFNPKLNTSWLHGKEKQLSLMKEQAPQQAPHVLQPPVPPQPVVSATPSSFSPSIPASSIHAASRRWKRQLLHAMSAKIHASSQVLSKQEIIKEALDIVCRVTSSERATVYLISEDRKEVVSYINKDPRQNLAIRVRYTTILPALYCSCVFFLICWHEVGTHCCFFIFVFVFFFLRTGQNGAGYCGYSGTKWNKHYCE